MYRSISILFSFSSSKMLIVRFTYTNITFMYGCAFHIIFKCNLLDDKQKLTSKDNSDLMGKKVGMSKSYLRTDPPVKYRRRISRLLGRFRAETTE